MQGYVQVYTGDGKGKTTAAVGLAARAAGAGLRVFFLQFMKSRKSSEIKSLELLGKHVTVRRFGTRRFVKGPPLPEDIAEAQRGLEEARLALRSGVHDLVILDEANVAVSVGLFDVSDLLALLDERPAQVELVLTGRGADPRLLRRADLVTEMKCVKHYFDAGVEGRPGIEC